MVQNIFNYQRVGKGSCSMVTYYEECETKQILPGKTKDIPLGAKFEVIEHQLECGNLYFYIKRPDNMDMTTPDYTYTTELQIVRML